jgi:peptidyl-prolyl cis-trans isomerase B (cyclophilin B)
VSALSLAICALSLAVVLAHSAAVVKPPGCRRVAAPRGRPAPLARPRTSLDPARTYVLELTTNCGEIAIKLDVRGSPLTTASVAYLAERGYYNDFPFDRVAYNYVIQVGEPNGQYHPISPGYTVRELPPRGTRYPFGTVAMFNIHQPAGTSGSEFFIVVGSSFKLPPRFTVLGRVVGSLRAVERISRVQVARPPDGAPLVPIVISRATLLVDGTPVRGRADHVEVAPEHDAAGGSAR